MDIEGKAEICLQHASVLLSDGRVSFDLQLVAIGVLVLSCVF